MLLVVADGAVSGDGAIAAGDCDRLRGSWLLRLNLGELRRWLLLARREQQTSDERHENGFPVHIRSNSASAEIDEQFFLGCPFATLDNRKDSALVLRTVY